MKKIVYLFPTNRTKLIAEVEKGIAPDNNLYGFNHLQNFFQVEQVEIPSKLEKILNLLFLPLIYIFNSRNTKLNVGRVILALPRVRRADVVVTCVDSVNKAAAFAKKIGLFSQPLICMAGNVMDGTEKLLFLHKWLWSGVHVVVTHAAVDQEKLSQLSLRNGVCIPVGSDDKFYRRKGIETMKELIVSVGADRDRDYRTLFSAALRLPRLKFIVCCEKENVEGLKIPDNVKVKINVSAIETRKILSKAHMVVLPLTETFRASGQLALIDSMLMRKVVIVSTVRGVVEPYGLENKKQALLMPPGNIESLVQSIGELQSNGRLRRKLGRTGRELALGYTTEQYAKKLKKVISFPG